MIIPMQKYSFLVYHKEYSAFLQNLQDLGVLHVIEKKTEVSEELSEQYKLLSRFDRIIKFLERREKEKEDKESADGLTIIEEITERQNESENLNQELITLKKEIIKVKPWGDFSAELIEKLKMNNLVMRFFISSKKKFSPEWLSDYNIEIISESGSTLYFLLVQHGDEEIDIDAEEINLPEKSFSEVKELINDIEKRIEKIESNFDDYAKESITAIEQAREEVAANLEYDKVVWNTNAEAEEKLMVLEGWVPNTKSEDIVKLLDENNVLYIKENPTKKDNIPVLLKNNRFSKLFEPIGELFSLPSYFELDITVFFAPFFMLFFGFCLGDAGYGLLFVLGATIYKFKAKKEIKPYLSLIQFLGGATIVFGIISGTLFGINLGAEEAKLFAKYKESFFDSEKMFNLALAFGALQIVFGMIIKVANQVKQFGFKYALGTVGWLIILLGGGVYAALTQLAVIDENIITLIVVLSIGGFFVLFMNDPEVNVFANFGKGIWDVYSTITGIFGDLLSYIRLFALGLSSAILGLVINDIGMQILGSSRILGPVLFVIFMLFGHTLNILIASLGSFVHPMRLTFVEFYKNAGFLGGGKQYKPFSK